MSEQRTPPPPPVFVGRLAGTSAEEAVDCVLHPHGGGELVFRGLAGGDVSLRCRVSPAGKGAEWTVPNWPDTPLAIVLPGNDGGAVGTCRSIEQAQQQWDVERRVDGFKALAQRIGLEAEDIEGYAATCDQLDVLRMTAEDATATVKVQRGSVAALRRRLLRGGNERNDPSPRGEARRRQGVSCRSR